MRLTRVLLLVLVALVYAGPFRAEAARDAAAQVSARRIEVLVLEVQDCAICSFVRQRMQPLYERSPRAKTAPMRFVDVTNLDETTIGLSSRITQVPTTVVMVDGREVDRIAGYWAPDMFMQIITRMLDNAE